MHLVLETYCIGLRGIFGRPDRCGRFFAGFAQTGQRPRGVLGSFPGRRVDLVIGAPGTIQCRGYGILERVTGGHGGSGGNLPCPDSGIHRPPGLVQLLLDPGDRKGQRFGAGGRITRQRIQFDQFLRQGAPGQLHGLQPVLQRLVSAGHFLAGIAGRLYHHLRLVRDGLVQGLHLRSQLTRQPFQGLTLLAQPFGQVAGIVGAGIGDRFQPQALIPDFAGHRLHRRQRMSHRPVDLGSRLFHLLGKGDAFGAGFAGRGHQADRGFHDQCIGGGRAAIGAAHEASHDHQQRRNDEGHGATHQQQRLLLHQFIDTKKSDRHRGCAENPGKGDHESGHNHPAAAMAGQLEVFRRLLPDKQVAARRASGGRFVHGGSIPRHFARRETRMCAFQGLGRGSP